MSFFSSSEEKPPMTVHFDCLKARQGLEPGMPGSLVVSQKQSILFNSEILPSLSYSFAMAKILFKYAGNRMSGREIFKKNC